MASQDSIDDGIKKIISTIRIIPDFLRRRQVCLSSPSEAVAAGIFQINTTVSTFRRLVVAIGTDKDTPEHRQKLHATRQSILQLVKDTSAKLKSLSESVHSANVTADIVNDLKNSSSKRKSILNADKKEVLNAWNRIDPRTREALRQSFLSVPLDGSEV